MSQENDNSTLFSMGSIFAGLICAGLSWSLLAPLMGNISVIILSIFIFAVTSWGIYEAFVDDYGASGEPQTFGENAVNPTVSKMGLTDRDAWTGVATGSSSAKMAAAPAALVTAGAAAVKSGGSKKASAPKAKAKTANKTAAKSTTTAKTSKPTAKKTAAPKAAAKKAGPTRLKKPKGKADDLKLISGVGPKLEKTLNGLGFWHFAQIAEWKRSDVVIVDDELSFKGRIDRDEWIKQAKKLAKQKA